MPSKAKAVQELLGETVSNWREDKAPQLAAALAYYTAFALSPLLVLAISIAGFVIGDSQQVRAQVVVQVEAAVGQQAAEMVVTLMDNASAGRSGVLAVAIGVAALLLGATGVFGQLQDALNTIWEVEAERRQGIWGLVKRRALSLALVVGMSFLLLLSLVMSAAISFANAYVGGMLGVDAAIAGPINVAVSLGIVTLVFAAVFKLLPDVDVAWTDVWAGALFTAVLFTLGKELLGLYLGRSSISSVYGAAGSLVVILAWVYYSAQILFLGAEFTQVYARRRGSRTDRDSRRSDWARS